MIRPAGLLLVDVSEHQGPLDWGAIAAAGAVGAYVRACEGVTPDKRYEEHRKGAEAAGLLVGAYQYCRARHTAEELASAFLRVKGAGLTLPPVLDVEDTDGALGDPLRTCVCDWLGIVEDAGLRGMIYTGAPFWDAYVDMYPVAPLWLAAYVREPPEVPRAWDEVGWTIWQFTDKWRYSTFAPHLDASVFRGSIEDLRALAGPPRPSPEAGAVDVDGEGGEP